ncbi:MOSC domain-containing protein [Agromyces soli]|uniref:MOSC domain-containing protein n=1 Tax=Agromyces soli TaxID=659012 RepID=A0ABY4AWV2_9MICO|nr:MOSC domain-containing protein [Agromyces soli]UOE26596.1 MOSC domain-containing protein [Agromyces soli]
MAPAHLERIVRYPVKGLPGVPETDGAELRPGRGLRWDRGHAVENGTVVPADRAAWQPRETYFHLAKYESIARIRTALDGGDGDDPVLTLSAADAVARVRLAGPSLDAAEADALLRATLPAGPLGPPTLVRTAAAGLWDWPAAHLSIINLATLEALAEAAGEVVDPRRFRGNLYLGGLPAWGELALLGRRVRLGGAVLEVFQPTDRCRATTINPLDAVSDLNVPALLASRFGHMFCGVYARVLEPGRIAPGDRIEPFDERSPLPEGEHGWPRTGRVVERRRESAAVTSFWFDDPLGLLPRAKPGQHVRIHAPGAAAPNWRCYTISATDGGAVESGPTGRFRISVKRDGRISTALHEQLEAGGELVITGPFGDVVLDEDASRDLLFVSAGAGITPTAAMLRARLAEPGTGRVRVVHSERDAASVALWDEVRDAVAALPDAEASLHLTRDSEGAERLGAASGRPDAATFGAILAELDLDRLDVYACGPGTFTADVRAQLAALGVDPERVQAEVFFSPSSAELAEPREPSTSGPHRITVGEDELDWRPESGSVLDAVEGIGIDWTSGCRVGVCGTCVRKLTSGTVEYLSEPLTPPPAGNVLVCCSAPTSDLVFDPGD